MRYFNYPETLNDLESQFNDLLNQYEYRSGKNASIIEEIRTEYKQIKRQMKQKIEAAERLARNTHAVKKPAGSAHAVEKSAGSVHAVEKSAGSIFETENSGRGVENYNTDLKRQEYNSGQMTQKKSDEDSQQAGWYAEHQDHYNGSTQQRINSFHAAQQKSVNSLHAVQQKSGGMNVMPQGASQNEVLRRSSGINTMQQNNFAGQLLHNAQLRQPVQRMIGKEEEQELLAQCKENITNILKEAAGNRSSDTYKMLEDAVFTQDDESVTRWFNMHTSNLASHAKVRAYDDVRRKLENEFKYAAQENQLEEAYMLKMEKLFGAYIKKKFIEYEILYKDYDDSNHQEAEQNVNKRLKKRGYILGIMMGALIFAIGCFFGLIGTVIGFICAVAAAVFIGKTYYDWRMPAEDNERIE